MHCFPEGDCTHTHKHTHAHTYVHKVRERERGMERERESCKINYLFNLYAFWKKNKLQYFKKIYEHCHIKILINVMINRLFRIFKMRCFILSAKDLQSI